MQLNINLSSDRFAMFNKQRDISPGPVLLGHADNQLFDFAVNPRPARGSAFLRAIKLASDEPSVPSQDGLRQGGSRHLANGLAAQPMANFAQLRSLDVRELQPPVQLAPQDPVFCSQILIPQQQLLVHRPRDEGQNACPLHKFPRLSADPQWPPSIGAKTWRTTRGEATPAWDKYPPFLQFQFFGHTGSPSARIGSLLRGFGISPSVAGKAEWP